MKKIFQKTLIAASVGAVLAVGSLSAAAASRNTTNLLFPYITSKTGAYTFISMVSANYGINGPLNLGASGPRPVHFSYLVKDVAASQTTACTHIDGDAIVTDNDLMQFEISGRFDMATLFGDVTSVPKLLPNIPNRQGMLLVNNNSDANYGSGGVYTSLILGGEARIIDTVSGLAFGYSTSDLHTANAANPDFNSTSGPDAAAPWKQVVWYPSSAVQTSWFFEPTSTEADMITGRANVNIALRNQAGFGGVYNHNEQFQSALPVNPVVCHAVLSRDALLGADGALFAGNGGWSQAYSTPGTTLGMVPVGNMLGYKMETTTAIAGKTISFIDRLTLP